MVEGLEKIDKMYASEKDALKSKIASLIKSNDLLKDQLRKSARSDDRGLGASGSGGIVDPSRCVLY